MNKSNAYDNSCNVGNDDNDDPGDWFAMVLQKHDVDGCFMCFHCRNFRLLTMDFVLWTFYNGLLIILCMDVYQVLEILNYYYRLFTMDILRLMFTTGS